MVKFLGWKQFKNKITSRKIIDFKQNNGGGITCYIEKNNRNFQEFSRGIKKMSPTFS